MRPAPLFLAACALCCAQVKLYVITDAATAAEREVTGSTLELGTAGPGDTIQTRFRMRNVGTTTQQIQTIRTAGQGFTLSIPSLPYALAPNGLPLDFTVRFSGTGAGAYSANLTAGTISVLLRATVAAAAVLVTESAPGARVDIAAGTTLFAGNIQRGQSGSKALWLENRNSQPLTVRSMGLSGSSAFQLRGPVAPLDLPGGASVRFDIDFSPTANQQYSGTLSIDGRTFPLVGTGFDPPLPKPSIVIDGTAASGQQPKLSIRLESPAASTVSGTLRMEFKPAAGPDDAAIRFAASGGRNLQVQSREGEAQLSIAQQPDAVFQTGTTAGDLTWTLEIGPHKIVQTMQIPPSAATIASATALRRTQDLDVSITGFDNTRSMNHAAFTFFDASGRPIPPGTIRVDVRRDFDQFFSTSTTGGVFTMRATFPVQGGPATQISGVEVEMVNSAGVANTQRLPFP